ncbi:MAG: glycosyltransferase family 4 protein [Planctomycetota bacterium]
MSNAETNDVPTPKGPRDVPDGSVAMLCQGTERYGIGSVVHNYARHCPDLRFVFTNRGPLTEWFDREGYPYRLIPSLSAVRAEHLLNPIKAWSVRRQAKADAARLAEVLADDGVACVHVHRLAQQLLGGMLRRHGFRVLWHIHNNMNHRRLIGLGTRINHALARWGADEIIAVSGFIANDWRVRGTPTRVIYNAAEPMFHEPGDAPTRPVRLMTAGRLEHDKGHHVAVEALKIALDAGADAVLDVFGGPLDDNPYADRLRAEVEPLDGRVRFFGFVDDLRDRHRQHDVGLQCRLSSEPCSVWVCESQLDGLALAASATGGTPELVEEGVSGLLYPPGDAKALARHIVTLCSDLGALAAMKRQSFERAQSLFTVERFIRESRDAWANATTNA